MNSDDRDPGELTFETLEAELQAEGLLEPPDPPRRVVVINPTPPHRHSALFVGEPDKELTVFNEDGSTPLELPWFDTGELTDQEVIEKLTTLIALNRRALAI